MLDQRKKMILFFSLLTGICVCLFHGYAMAVNPKFHGTFDIFLHILITITQTACIVSGLELFRSNILRIKTQKKFIYLFFAAAAANLIFLMVVVCFREQIAVQFSDQTIRYYYTNPYSPLNEMHYIGLEEWRDKWKSGVILLLEIIYCLGLAAFLLLPAVFAKNRPKFYPAFIPVIAFMIIYPVISGMTKLDYDFFLGSIISDALALSLFCLPFGSCGTISISLFIFISINALALYITSKVLWRA